MRPFWKQELVLTRVLRWKWFFAVQLLEGLVLVEVVSAAPQ
jgi:hypothetical protein